MTHPGQSNEDFLALLKKHQLANAETIEERLKTSKAIEAKFRANGESLSSLHLSFHFIAWATKLITVDCVDPVPKLQNTSIEAYNGGFKITFEVKLDTAGGEVAVVSK